MGRRLLWDPTQSIAVSHGYTLADEQAVEGEDGSSAGITLQAVVDGRGGASGGRGQSTLRLKSSFPNRRRQNCPTAAPPVAPPLTSCSASTSHLPLSSPALLHMHRIQKATHRILR